MKKLNATALAVLMTAGLITASYAQTNTTSKLVTTCGALEGMSYFVPNDTMPDDKAGWTQDKLSPGGVGLVKDGDNYDLLFVNTMIGTFSVTERGFTLRKIIDDPDKGILILSVTNPKAAHDSYFFKLDKEGNGEVLWSNFKWGGAADKGSLMTGICINRQTD